jgi:hypothetical protein
MLSSTDRPAVSGLFRPSVLAWRAKHLAEKAARAAEPRTTTPKRPRPIPTPRPASVAPKNYNKY